jgi:hypothetical protein
VADEQVEADRDRQPRADDDEPPDGIEQAAHQRHRTREQFRHRQAQRFRAPHELHALVDEQNDAEGRHHVVEMVARVELPKHQQFERERKCERRGKRQHQRREEAAGEAVERHRQIGAQHVLNAVREVDEVHHPEHQRQPGRDQEQQHPELQPVEDLYEEKRRH